MQKRSTCAGEILFEPVEFDRKLPVILNPHSDPDRPMGRMHYHNAVEVSLCTEGSGVFFVGENVFSYREGTLVFIPPNTAHSSYGEAGKSALWITMYIDLNTCGLESFSGGRSGFHVLDGFEHPRLPDAIDGIFRECTTNDPLALDGVRGYLQVLIVELYRSVGKEGPRPLADRHSLSRIVPALNHIAENPGRSMSIAELARLSGMSESNFRRLFCNCMGQSPHLYVLQVRIHLAKSLLHDPCLRIIEIAGRCGFETLSTFNRAFRKLTGMTPREWRKGQG
jgi:AraC-like DNA-binding protein